MADEKILIVDDEEHVCRLCSEILRHRDYKVITARSSQDALEIAKAESFDLLLTDICMPGMDGLELLQAIKEVQKNIAAVVITGYGTVDHAIQSLHLGAQGFLIKPFSRKELIQAVEDALERNRILQDNMRLKLLVPLFEVSKTLLSELNLRTLLDTVTGVAMRETRSDAASVILLQEDGRLVLKSHTSPNGIYTEAICQRVTDTIGRWVVEQRKPLIVIKESPVSDEIREVVDQLGLSAMITMPLITKDKVVGLLHLFKKGSTVNYNQSDIELISILSGQAAIAIENAKLFEEIQRKNQALEEFYFESVKALAQAIEAKDSTTGSHGDRLVGYAMAIADRLGLSNDEKIWLRYAAALHDIGKIAVSEAILRKPGKLTVQEYDEMKTHPVRGAEILREVKFLAPVVPIVYHHQEQFDGGGYPDGLRGEQIPIGSRIVAVLDAFDAMTSDRPYRNALPLQTAIRILKERSGLQFDPKVVEVFVEVVEGPSQTV
jgi:putative nucleotidyltransferase with HDIG domain